MEREVAETVVRATREEAELRARDDLDQLRRQAVEAGRERSRKIIKITNINTSTGGISYNPAGRLLRDWYLHVYINSVRANLGQPNEAIDAQQVQDTALLLERVRPGAEPLQATSAVDATRKIAVADAAAAVARIIERLADAGAVRAIRQAPDHRFDSDPLRVHVTRHWYQRSYDRTVEEAVNARHARTAANDAEMVHVADALVTREARRLLGHDGALVLPAYSDGLRIEGPAADAAMKMFNHTTLLTTSQIAGQEDDLACLDRGGSRQEPAAWSLDAPAISDRGSDTRRIQ